MPGIIEVNYRNIDAEAAKIASSADYFRGAALAPQDTRTTLPANKNGKAVYRKAQEHVEALGASLNREAGNIRELYESFEEFDNMMGGL